MFTPWIDGGDYSPKNQLRNPLKVRYTSRPESYSLTSGSANAPVTQQGMAKLNVMRQVRRSYGHPYRLLGKSGYDIGGEFLSLRTEVSGGTDLSIERSYSGNPGYITNWAGWVCASDDARSLLSASQRTAAQELAFLSSNVPSHGTLDMYRDGATAVNRTIPTNPVVDLSTSMAELLREGLPSFPGKQGNIGGEYLNYQFGIAPLVSDIRDMRRVLNDADALWAQYQKGSGKHTRRHYEFPLQVENTSSTKGNRLPQVVSINRNDGSVYAIGFSGAHCQPGTLSQSITTELKVWFDGAFTYYLPDSGWKREMDRLDKLYGLVPGVDTLYQLTPWSWLVDYFSNLGDVIENLNAFSSNGLVMPYAYIMAQKTVTISSTLEYRMWNGTTFVPRTVSDVVRKTSKRRLPATPFGFGLSDGDLSPKQWSILAALGLSRR